MASVKFIQALELLEKERGIQKDVVLDALKEALEKSYKKNYGGPESIIRVDINEKSGKIRLYEIRNVVDDVFDEDYEISIEEAQEIDPKYNIGDQVVTEVDPSVFGRLAAVQTKQLLRQKIREVEKETLYNEYIDKKDDIITGIVDRVEPRFAIINIGKTGALLPINQQIPGEKIYEGQHIKVYLNDIERTTKGTHIGVSRTEPGLVKRLFEMEVPEIYDGTIEVKSVARDAGERSKIAVYSNKSEVDPIGTCVGPKGNRVRNIVNELNGEMIDIVEWNENPIVFIQNALSPAEIISVQINEEEKSALVIVPDKQLSLAIGKKGQNARLAVRLTGWKIDIKSESEAIELGLAINEDMQFEMDFEKEMTSHDEIQEDTFEEETLEDVVEDVQVSVDETSEKYEEDIEEFEDDEEYDYDPKYDEDIDYDEYDKYYE